MTDLSTHSRSTESGGSLSRLTRLRPRQTVVAIGALLIVALIATAAVTITRSRHQQLDAAGRELSQLGLTLSEETGRTIEAIGSLLTDAQSRLDVAGVVTSEDMRRYAGAKEFHQYLQGRVRDSQQIDALSVFDSDGRLIASSREWPAPELDVSDREYFLISRDTSTTIPVIGEPVRSRITGEWVINYARRVSGPDGTFLGIIVGAIQASYFEDFYRAISEDSERAIALFRRDGILLARYPQADAGIGSNLGHRPVFTETLAKATSGILYGSSAIDHLPRLMATRAVRNYPLAIVVSNTQRTILAAWQRLTVVILCITGAAIMLIVFLGVLLDRQLRLQSRIAETQAERTRADHARQAAEISSKAKSDFLANMSHELRTPLNAVIGFAEMLQSGTFGALNAKQSEYVRDIRMSGRHLLGLINTVLDMAKIEAGRFDLHEELIEPAALFDDAVMFLDLHAKKRGVELKVAAPKDLPLMLADRRAVLQVILNLLTNALNFTTAGGSVTLMASVAESGALEIAVADTGIGISAAAMDRIFEPFQSADASLSRKLGGAGLGLAVSKMLVERHGGSLRLESAIGKGTTVHIRLPAERVVGHKSLFHRPAAATVRQVG